MDMSFVFAAPELVTSAAGDLAGIRSALSEATSAASTPTTGLMAAGADEVSAAIAQLFGSYGQEFQGLSAEAAAFHDSFVGLLHSGAAAYAGTEAASVQQILGGAAPAAAPGSAFGSAGQNFSAAAAAVSGQIQAEAQTLGGIGASIAGPYQALGSTTVANLQTLNSAVSANPTPFLHQVLANEGAFDQAIGSSFQTGIQNLPAELANLPASVQAGFQGLSTANPGAVLQGIINNQTGFQQTIVSSLQHANSDLMAGFNQLPASFQAANNAFAVGDVTGGLKLIGGGFLNPFLSGFSTVTGDGGVITVTPVGALGDVLPIFSIPGQMAQNFTNLLPAGSLPAQLSQNFTNVVNTLTSTSVTSEVGLVLDGSPPLGFGLSIDAHMGLPLQLAIEAIGGPVNGLNALGSSATTFVNAIQTGDPVGAATAAFDAPGNFVNGFLNGQTTLPLSLTVDLFGTPFPTTLNVPLDGLLVPAAPYQAMIDGTALIGEPLTLDATVTGTPIGGLLPSLLGFLPADLASVIGGPPAPVFAPLF
jgi:PE family